jgi:hypothetical protein
VVYAVRKNKTRYSAVLAALFVIVLFLSFEMGRYNVSLIDVKRNIISDGFNLDKLLSGMI